MIHLTLMIVLTGSIAVLGLLTWLKTRSIAFPIGLFFLYFWSLHGAWSIITDKMGGDSGKRYHYLEAKMFAIQLDSAYFWALAYYGLFIIVTAVVTLVLARRPPPAPAAEAPQHKPLEISHTTVSAIALAAAVLGMMIILPSIEKARALNVSAYSLKGGHADLPPLFSVYQILNRAALLPAMAGLATIASGRNPRYVCGRSGRWSLALYVVVLGGLFSLSFMMGGKNELFFSGLAAVLFYIANARKPRYGVLTALGVVGFLGLALVDLLRGVPLPMLSQALSNMSPAEMIDAAQSLSTSNEAFGPHFSMYGVLAYRVPPTYGSSLVGLALSAVPRLVWEDRPPDIYEYYAEGVQAMPDQGYGLHHATGWYLNFGVSGIFIGAILLGVVWSACYNRHLEANAIRSRFWRTAAILAPWTFTAYLPALIRAGPEAYKGVIIEAFLVPTIVFWLSASKIRVVWRARDARRLRAASSGTAANA